MLVHWTLPVFIFFGTERLQKMVVFQSSVKLTKQPLLWPPIASLPYPRLMVLREHVLYFYLMTKRDPPSETTCFVDQEAIENAQIMWNYSRMGRPVCSQYGGVRKRVGVVATLGSWSQVCGCRQRKL